MNDIFDDYREWAAWLRETTGTSPVSIVLTDTERDALTTAVYEAEAHQQNSRAAILRGLLERHFPAPENQPPQDNTPHPHSTPRKGSVPADCTKAGEK